MFGHRKKLLQGWNASMKHGDVTKLASEKSSPSFLLSCSDEVELPEIPTLQFRWRSPANNAVLEKNISSLLSFRVYKQT